MQICMLITFERCKLFIIMTSTGWSVTVCVFVLQFLIGYNRGLIVLWDNEASNADQTYNSTQASVGCNVTHSHWLKPSNKYTHLHQGYNPIYQDIQHEGGKWIICHYAKSIQIRWITWIMCFLQQLESLSWHRNGTEFMSAHNDGSYIVWSTTNSAEPKEPALTPYGNIYIKHERREIISWEGNW